MVTSFPSLSICQQKQKRGQSILLIMKKKKKKHLLSPKKNKKQIENQLLLIMKMNINQQIKEKNNLSFSYWQEKIGIKNFF